MERWPLASCFTSRDPAASVTPGCFRPCKLKRSSSAIALVSIALAIIRCQAESKPVLVIGLPVTVTVNEGEDRYEGSAGVLVIALVIICARKCSRV